MAEDRTETEAAIEGIGTWETIAMVIMLAVMSAAIGAFAYGITSHGIGH